MMLENNLLRLDGVLNENDYPEVDPDGAVELIPGSEIIFFRLFSASVSGDLAAVKQCALKLTSAEIKQVNPLSDSASYGLTALHVAKTVAVAKVLLESGIPIDIKGLHSQTALHTHYDSPELVRFLLRMHAKVDQTTATNGSTPLQWAVAADQESVVKELIAAGADVNHQNFVGNTALHLAVSPAVAKILVNSGARMDIQNQEGNVPMEEAAARAVHDTHFDCAMYLLEVSKKQYLFVRNYDNDDDFDLGCASNDYLEKYHDLKQRRSEGREEEENGAYQSIEHNPKKGLKKKRQSVRQSVVVESAESGARAKWNLLKTAFIKHGSSRKAPISRKQRSIDRGISMNLSSFDTIPSHEDESDAFYASFFELLVKEKPKLALKVLDRQRTFLYWENSNKVYRYNTSLLGTIPNSSSAVKQMIQDSHLELVSHPVVQFSLTARWILFTREILFFEAWLHCLWLILLVVTTSFGSRDVKVVQLFNDPDSVIQDPFEPVLMLCELLTFLLNIRYMRLQVVQARIAAISCGKTIRLSDLLHSRNENFYLVIHLLLIVSQVLRCIPNSPACYDAADLLYAIVSWRLFTRTLHFFECFEAVGVPLSIITNTLSENYVYFLILFMSLIGFSHSMSLLFRTEVDNYQYGSYPRSLVTLFFFLYNLDLETIYSEPDVIKQYVSFIIIGTFMTMCVLVITNMLVAVMTNTFDRINSASRKEWLMQRARVILFYEHYDLALSYILHPVTRTSVNQEFDRIFENEYYPVGGKRFTVKEQVDGTASIELPKDYVAECVRYRQEKSTIFHKFRYSIFHCWKKRLRRSNSFLWPSHRNISGYEAVNETSPLTPQPLGSTSNKRKGVQQIGSFITPIAGGDNDDLKQIKALLQQVTVQQKVLSKEIAALAAAR